MAHPNVERVDLKNDPDLPALAGAARQGASAAGGDSARRRSLHDDGVADADVDRADASAGQGARLRRGRHAASPSIASAICARDQSSRSMSRHLRPGNSPAATAMSNSSTISKPAKRPTAGFTRSSAMATAQAGITPKRVSARMCSTPRSPIAASRNPIPARRRAFPRASFCAWRRSPAETLLPSDLSGFGKLASALDDHAHLAQRNRRRTRAQGYRDPAAPVRSTGVSAKCSMRTLLREAGPASLCDHPRRDLSAVRLSWRPGRGAAASAWITCSAFDL